MKRKGYSKFLRKLHKKCVNYTKIVQTAHFCVVIGETIVSKTIATERIKLHRDRQDKTRYDQFIIFMP